MFTCASSEADPVRRLRRLAGLALAALIPLLASCATLPAARVGESPWAALPGDGDLYLFADVQQARSLLEPLAAGLPRAKPGQVDQLLDRTAEVYACLYLPDVRPGEAEPPARPAAELAVTGRFSPDLVSLRLSFDFGWVRHEPAPQLEYWRGRRSPLEVGSPAPGLLLAAAGRPGALEGMLLRRLAPDAGSVVRAREADPRAREFLRGAALYAFLPTLPASPGFAPAGAARGLPLGQLWLAARRQGGGYELGVLAALDGKPNPQALASLVRLAVAALLRKAGIPEVVARLRAIQIIMDEEGLAVRGLQLSEAELLAALQGWLRSETAGEAGARRGD